MPQPNPFNSLGRLFIVLGAVALLAGLVLVFRDRIPMLGKLLGWLGNLPGDIRLERGNLRVYFPIVTCAVISLLLTLLFNIFRK